ncbi:hypothetical protein [Streptomyces canus]|uniref:hypothetical protein n=1 Tax=Streptomyces canus TaxID=58343 RepID=UPI00074B2F28|nr:hypothetical protein [Streptomyces canus]KUN12709.1 hypothetical protein AQI96_13025 [Streptomyces canus]
MNSSTAVFPLFGEDAEQARAEIQPPPARLGMAAAAAHLVAYRDTQFEDGEQRVSLVVACPFCDHQHIHPAGLVSAPRVCPRTSRCVGRPTGTYYFPAVQRDR